VIRDENHDCYGGDVGEELRNNLNQTSNNETSERQYDSLNDTGHSVFDSLSDFYDKLQSKFFRVMTPNWFKIQINFVFNWRGGLMRFLVFRDLEKCLIF